MARPQIYIVPKQFEIYRTLDDASTWALMSYEKALLAISAQILSDFQRPDDPPCPVIAPEYAAEAERRKVPLLKSGSAEQYEYAQSIKRDRGRGLVRTLLSEKRPEVDDHHLSVSYGEPQAVTHEKTTSVTVLFAKNPEITDVQKRLFLAFKDYINPHEIRVTHTASRTKLFDVSSDNTKVHYAINRAVRETPRDELANLRLEPIVFGGELFEPRQQSNNLLRRS